MCCTHETEPLIGVSAHRLSEEDRAILIGVLAGDIVKRLKAKMNEREVLDFDRVKRRAANAPGIDGKGKMGAGKQDRKPAPKCARNGRSALRVKAPIRRTE